MVKKIKIMRMTTMTTMKESKYEEESEDGYEMEDSHDNNDIDDNDESEESQTKSERYKENIHIKRAQNVFSVTNQQTPASLSTKGARSNSEVRQLEERLSWIDADVNLNCEQECECDEEGEDELSTTKSERLNDPSTDNTNLGRDWDEKTSVLESNGGGLLWGPPQAISSPA